MLTKVRVINTLSTITKKAVEFIYTDFYAPLIALLTLFFWVSGFSLAGVLLFSLIGTFIFVVQRDMTPVLPLLLSIFFLPSNLSIFSNILSYLVFLPALGGLIYHFIKYPLKEFYFGKLLFPLFLIFFTMLLGGIFSDEILSYGLGLVQIFGIGFAMLFAYVVLSQYICPSEAFDNKHYFYHSLLIICAVPCVEMFFSTLFFINCPTGVITYKTLGWGDKNFIGYMILLAVPICFYFIVKAQKQRMYIYMGALVFFLISILFISCDGATGILIVCTPFLFYFTYKRVTVNKKQAVIYFAYAVLLTIAIILLIISIASGNLIGYLNTHFFNDTGRTRIYKQAMELFAKHPIFGVGVYYPVLKGSVGYINYHSTIHHALATTGICGFLAYAYLTYKRIKIAVQNFSDFNFYGLLSIIFYMAYCFIDCGEFLMIVIFINVITLILERENTHPEKNTLKPLKVLSKRV